MACTDRLNQSIASQPAAGLTHLTQQMNSGTQADEEVELPPFPKPKWVVLTVALWFLFGCVPLLLVVFGTTRFKVADSKMAEVAGTIGDAFGLANSFFSAGALLFVIWSIRLQQQEIKFARKEWEENTLSQNKQVEMMKEAAELSAINHIYTHYSEEYGKNDPTKIREKVAAGHRMWAIRESFDKIDNAFSEERKSQVRKQFSKLLELIRECADKGHNEIEVNTDNDGIWTIAELTASLLVDQRISEKKKRLWPLYEILRENNSETTWSSEKSSRFKKIASELIDPTSL